MTCSEAAHKYLDRGWTPVPIGAQKVPWIKWTEFQSRRPSHAEIDAWFAERPDSKVGIVTGKLSGITVVDVDKASALDELAKLCPGVVAPAVKTPRGGRHYYFKYHPALVNRARVMDGVDIRTEGGLVVAPPSENYSWLVPQDTPLGDVPPALVRACTGLGTRNSGIVRHIDGPILEEGHRNDDLFTILYGMAKGGMRGNELKKAAYDLGRKAGLEDREIAGVINSATERAGRPERAGAKEIEEWVRRTSGPFTMRELKIDLGFESAQQKGLAATTIHRLKDSRVIEPTGRKNGEYRLIECDLRPVNWQTAPMENLDVHWEFGIEKLAAVYEKNIIIVAGRSNAGKTALLLDFVKRNMNRFECHYFSSEMAESEARRRIEKHTDIKPGQWDFQMWDRSHHFADVIRPNAINVIDYLESLEGEDYKVSSYISQIWNKLDKGIAVIAIQKNKGRDIGRGGEGTLSRSRLYLSIDDGIIKIVKAKNWATEENPNGLCRRFKLIQGWKFISTSEWLTPEQIENEKMCAGFEPKHRKVVLDMLGGKRGKTEGI